MAAIFGTKVFSDGREFEFATPKSYAKGELAYRIMVRGESPYDPWEFYNGLGCGPEMFVAFTEFGDLYRFMAEQEAEGQEWYGPMYRIVIVESDGNGVWNPNGNELF